MSHSITMLKVGDGDARADEILEGLAERLDVPHIWKDGAGRAQLWLQFNPDRAYDTVITALDDAAADWRAHLTVFDPHEQSWDAGQP